MLRGNHCIIFQGGTGRPNEHDSTADKILINRAGTGRNDQQQRYDEILSQITHYQFFAAAGVNQRWRGDSAPGIDTEIKIFIQQISLPIKLHVLKLSPTLSGHWILSLTHGKSAIWYQVQIPWSLPLSYSETSKLHFWALCLDIFTAKDPFFYRCLTILYTNTHTLQPTVWHFVDISRRRSMRLLKLRKTNHVLSCVVSSLFIPSIPTLKHWIILM